MASSPMSSLVQLPSVTVTKLETRFSAAMLPTSRFRGHAIYKINGLQTLELKDLPQVPADNTDYMLQIPVGEEFRPDLFSRRRYVTPHLWWVLMRANGLSDPFTEFYRGRTIRVPTQSRIFSNILV